MKSLLVNSKGNKQFLRFRWFFELQEFELHEFNCNNISFHFRLFLGITNDKILRNIQKTYSEFSTKKGLSVFKYSSYLPSRKAAKKTHSWEKGGRIKKSESPWVDWYYSRPLTRFMPLISFDTPENIRKPLVLCFNGDIERDHWHEME